MPFRHPAKPERNRGQRAGWRGVSTDADAGALKRQRHENNHLRASRQRDTGYARRGMHKPSENSRRLTSQRGKMSGNITHSGGDFTSNGITVHTHKHGGVKGGSRFDRRPAVTTRYTGMNPDGTGNLNDMEHLETVSQGHPDHPLAKPGYATGIWQP